MWGMDPRPLFLDALKAAPMVFDGATGTMLYDRGIYLSRSFDELCLSRPELVRDVHRDYIDVGVQVIQTNSYGANPLALAQHGLEEKSEAICRAAVDVAQQASAGRVYVAGSVGPTGLLPKDLLRNRTRRDAFDAFRVVTTTLASSGADLLLFETFGYLGELEIAIEASYDVRVPLVAQVSFDDEGLTLDGAGPEEVKSRLLSLGVDVIGANCVLGPERLLDIMDPMVDGETLLIMQPNAGYPRTVDGRAIYQASPETFGVVARRAFKRGIRAVGGCCGTTPEHMRRVVAAARMMGGGTQSQRSRAPVATVKEPGVPLAERSRWGQKIARGEFAISVEVSPPLGLDPTKTLEKIRSLEGSGVDVVNIPDGPRATVRMSNIAMAKRVLDETGMEPLVHFCARDRNLLGLQSDLLGAHALGIHNLVVITGDPPKVGDYPDATAVFDLDSVGMLQMASGLNAGIDPAGKAVKGTTQFVLATGAEPAALDFAREIERVRDKVEAGAELVMTQPVYDPDTLETFLGAIQDVHVPVLVGILPLASVRNAEFLSNNVPGMRVPDDILDRLRKADDAAQEGVRIAAEMLAAVKSRVQGAYIMPPFGKVRLALDILERL